MLTEITLESGCKSTTFLNTIQIIQKENSKKKHFFTPQMGKSTTRTISPIYIILGQKKKNTHYTRFIKKYKLQTNSFLFLSIQKPPKHRQSSLHSAKAMQLGPKSNPFTTQKHCNYTVKRLLLPNT